MHQTWKPQLRRAVALVGAAALLVAVAPAATAKAKAKAKKKAAAITVKRTTTTVARTPATQAPAVSRGTVLIGVLGTSVSPTTAQRQVEYGRKISEAWATRVNAAGGINGYKVAIAYRDVANDVARANAAVREFDKLGVAVVTQEILAQMSAVMPFLESKKIPIIGGYIPAFPEASTSPMFFPAFGNTDTATAGIVNAARDAGAKHFRKLFCAELAACGANDALQRATAQRLALGYSSQSGSLFAVDYTAQCLSARSAGADFLQVDGIPLAPVVRDCGRQNYHPMYGAAGTASGGPGLFGPLAGERYAQAASGPLPAWYAGPEMRDFKALHAFTDLDQSAPTQNAFQMWQTFTVIGNILEKMTAMNPTRADFLAATYLIKGETVNGTAQPGGLDYTVQKDPNRHALTDCWLEIVALDGGLQMMDTNGRNIDSLAKGWQCGSGAFDPSGFPRK
jgi:hypothetical protein